MNVGNWIPKDTEQIKGFMRFFDKILETLDALDAPNVKEDEQQKNLEKLTTLLQSHTAQNSTVTYADLADVLLYLFSVMSVEDPEEKSENGKQ